VQALDALGEPVRRRILEIIADTEVAAGVIADALRDELGLSQPGCSQHLKVLRESGLLQMRAVGTSRLYRIDAERLADAAAWFDQFNRFGDQWRQPLDALETELARGRRERRRSTGDAAGGDPPRAARTSCAAGP